MLKPSEALKLKAWVGAIHGIEAAEALGDIANDEFQQMIALASFDTDFIIEKFQYHQLGTKIK